MKSGSKQFRSSGASLNLLGRAVSGRSQLQPESKIEAMLVSYYPACIQRNKSCTLGQEIGFKVIYTLRKLQGQAAKRLPQVLDIHGS